jgi:hypothetical protein
MVLLLWVVIPISSLVLILWRIGHYQISFLCYFFMSLSYFIFHFTGHFWCIIALYLESVLPGVAIVMLATLACAFLFSLIFHSKMKKLQSPIIFMTCLMGLYCSMSLYRSYWVYLGPFARNVIGIVVIGCLITLGCDTYLFLSFDSMKDRTLPNLIFMLFLMSLPYFYFTLFVICVS